MCRQVQCSECHKPTFAGCGMHVEQVLGHVPREERCMCREKAKKKAEPTKTSSIFRRMLGLC